MNDLEDKFKKVKTKKLNEEDKQSLWHAILVSHLKELQNPKHTMFSIFTYRKVFVGALLLLLVIGTGGSGVLAESKNSLPGDLLFPVGLLVEKIQINLAPESKKNELKFQFAQDHISKIKNISKEKINPVKFSQEEIKDINAALTDVGALVESKQEGEKAQNVEKSLNELLVILGDESDLKVTKTDGDISVTKEDDTSISIPPETTPKEDTSNDAGMEVDLDETAPRIPIDDSLKTTPATTDTTSPDTNTKNATGVSKPEGTTPATLVTPSN